MSTVCAVHDVDLHALEAAATFASTDPVRGVITNVASFRADCRSYYVATDSFVMGVVTPDHDVSPSTIVNEITGDRTDITLVPATLVHSAFKALPKGKSGPVSSTRSNVTFEARLRIMSKVTWESAERIEVGEFPNFANLFDRDQPLTAPSVTFAVDKLTQLGKAAKLIHPGYEYLTYLGQRQGKDKVGDPIKAGYWYASGEHGTLLAIAMPVRGGSSREWTS